MLKGLAPVVLIAALLAGCGGEEVDPEVVAKAAAETASRESARVTFTGTSKVGDIDVESTGSGVVRFKPAGGYMEVESSAEDQTLETKVVLDGTAMYMNLPPEAGATLPDDASWIKIDLDQALGNQAFSSAMSSGSDPTQFLRLLAGSGKVTKHNQQDINGHQSTHYKAVIDYEKLARSGPPELKALAEQTLRFTDDATAPVEVWVDENGLVRRQKIEFSTKSIGGAPAQEQEVTYDYVEYDVGTDQIEAPPEDEVYDATEETAGVLNQP